jgi:hypothetical protein
MIKTTDPHHLFEMPGGGSGRNQASPRMYSVGTVLGTRTS